MPFPYHRKLNIGGEIIEIKVDQKQTFVKRGGRWMEAKYKPPRAKEFARTVKDGKRRILTKREVVSLKRGLKSGRWRTQTDAGRHFGVSQTVISHIVQGRISG